MSKKLENWRKQVDILDEKILNLLAKRMDISLRIGRYKKEHNLPLFDKKRWSQILKSNLDKTESLNLSKDFVKKLLILIHGHSLKLQKKK